MNEKYTQAYILELLEKAKKADFEFKVFGADKHRYKLNPTVSMGEVLKWEEDFNIKLPDDYVYFLTQIGNGGAGPYYGLYSLDELRQQQYYKRQDNKQNPIIDASLSKEKWNELMEQLDSADDDMYEEIEQYINTGVVIIGTQGCTYDNLLMCNGSETGKIVYIDWNLEGEYPPFLTRMSFFEWYIGFFEDIIAGYSVCSYGYNKRGTQQDLQQDYSKSYRLEDKLINLQGFLRFDTLAVETLDFLYNIHDVEVDSARLAILLKFKADLGMNLFDKFIEGENISAAISNIRRIPKEIQQKYYKKAIEINPKEVNAYILLGNLYSNLKKYDKAESQYREALKINKLDPSIFVLIANTYYMNNEIERSIFSYRAAVNLRPENDEYKLVFIQVLEDYINDARKGDLVANF